ncbi:polysaccharide deacetylase family protein [Aestuariivirga sp.]|uniref:polysaccharide deacetylase family protein n=1 Tax=Aestuariivirga sp. TaxID=2650926 RepID=UPI00391DA6AC
MSSSRTIQMVDNPVPWPNGARCALAMTFDIDTDSFLHLDHGERVPDMVSTTSWLRYDEVAVPRILRIFKAFGLHQTFFFPAWCMENYPHLVDAILKDGHEIAHHGYLHESPNLLSREEELAWLQRGIDVIVRMTGRRPRGYRAPVYNFSRHTADLLAQEEFLYDATLMADEVPYLMKTNAGPLMELPSHWAMDDWPQFAHNIELQYMMTIRSPDEAFAVYEAELESACRNGALCVGVWHPWLMGRLARAERLAVFIEGILKRGDVWIASMEEIAGHIIECKAAGTFNPREVSMPYYSVGLPQPDRPNQTK